jgi:hypothetical protein
MTGPHYRSEQVRDTCHRPTTATLHGPATRGGRCGVASLSGILTGIGICTTFGVLRRVDLRPPLPVATALLGLTDGVHGHVDARPAGQRPEELVGRGLAEQSGPHVAYGAVTAARRPLVGDRVRPPRSTPSATSIPAQVLSFRYTDTSVRSTATTPALSRRVRALHPCAASCTSTTPKPRGSGHATATDSASTAPLWDRPTIRWNAATSPTQPSSA